MSVTKTIDLSGTSTQSLEAAIEEAISRAALTISDVTEFEIEKVTGTVKDGKGGRVPRLAQGHLPREGEIARMSDREGAARRASEIVERKGAPESGESNSHSARTSRCPTRASSA